MLYALDLNDPDATPSSPGARQLGVGGRAEEAESFAEWLDYIVPSELTVDC